MERTKAEQDRVDRKWSSSFLRILTLNMHGRPLDTVPIVGGVIRGIVYNQKVCDPLYHFQNAQERRMRAFFEWLDSISPLLWPDIVCFQEVTWSGWFETTHAQLVQRQYQTHSSIDWRQSSATAGPIANSGLGIYVLTSRQCLIVSAGQQAFKQQLGYDQLTNKGMMYALVKCSPPSLNMPLDTGPIYVVVVNTHTLAYIEYPANPASASEHDQRVAPKTLNKSVAGLATATAPPQPTMPSLTTTEFRLHAANQMNEGGGFIAAVKKTHGLQVAQIRAFVDSVVMTAVQEYKVQLSGLYYVGDFNINRYRPLPNSAASQKKESAGVCCGDEFFDMLETLDAEEPPIVMAPSTSSSCSGLFTWDSTCNTVISNEGLGSKTLEWIDYVLYFCGSKRESQILCRHFVDGNSVPLYMDNRMTEMRTWRAFPELTAFWQPSCINKRIEYLRSLTTGSTASDPFVAFLVKQLEFINRTYTERIVLGFQQLEHLLLPFGKARWPREWILNQSFGFPESVFIQRVWRTIGDAASSATTPVQLYTDWCEFVWQADQDATLQVWKGIDYYGWRSSDRNLSEPWFDPTGRPRLIGEPHGYRMLRHPSDHFGVMSSILLPTAFNRQRWRSFLLSEAESRQRHCQSAPVVDKHVAATQRNVLTDRWNQQATLLSTMYPKDTTRGGGGHSRAYYHRRRHTQSHRSRK